MKELFSSDKTDILEGKSGQLEKYREPEDIF
jgi:hypothetical protein